VKRLIGALGLLLAVHLPAAESIRDLNRRVRETGLDAGECYRVRDLRLSRDDLRFYFDDGYLIFGKAIDGVRLSAVFTADVEAGNAELLVLPPHRSERGSLVFYTHAPNLEQHFDSAVLVFTGETYAELMQSILRNGPPEKSPEHGAELAQAWNPAVQNLLSASAVHVLGDLLSGTADGFFYAALEDRTLGNFDAIYNPPNKEQITVGQVVTRGQQSYFDIWTRFEGLAFRNGTRKAPPPDIKVTGYRIDATLDANLHMQVVTEATVVPSAQGIRALPFDLTPAMRVTEVRIDGAPAEFLQPDAPSLEHNEGDVSQQFLVLAPQALEAGKEHKIEFHHEGGIVADHGDAGYFVTARSTWYPQAGFQFARYDLTFHYPAGIDLAATGTLIEQGTEGERRTARYRMDEPVLMAGFNLGHYRREQASHGDYTVDVYANQQPENVPSSAPQLPPAGIALHTGFGQPGIQTGRVETRQAGTEINPGARLPRIAADIAGALEFMSAYFGPPALKTLRVTPIPGAFGQGFPGLIYLSTLAYRDPKQLDAGRRPGEERPFDAEIMCAHETAHQWWGNTVTTEGDGDHWIMEALANYSALLYLEKRHGPQALETVLNRYKLDLFELDKNGNTADSIGPISWGPRLINSHSDNAYRAIIYEKGSWIMHMLRRRMGDERFLAMLGGLYKRYSYRTIGTDEFREFAAAFLPPHSADPKLENFFEQWVYSTGIPTLKLQYTTRGAAPNVRVSGTVTGTGTGEDFTAYVPVVIELGKGKSVTKWLQTSSEPATFTLVVQQPPAKVLLDPANSVLHR